MMLLNNWFIARSGTRQEISNYIDGEETVMRKIQE